MGVNAAVGNDDFETYTATDDTSILRSGTWYIAIEVFNSTEKDCLMDESISRDKVLPYLRAMKEEYLSTQNYNEIVFKN